MKLERTEKEKTLSSGQLLLQFPSNLLLLLLPVGNEKPHVRAWRTAPRSTFPTSLPGNGVGQSAPPLKPHYSPQCGEPLRFISVSPISLYLHTSSTTTEHGATSSSSSSICNCYCCHLVPVADSRAFGASLGLLCHRQHRQTASSLANGSSCPALILESLPLPYLNSSHWPSDTKQRFLFYSFSILISSRSCSGLRRNRRSWL